MGVDCKIHLPAATKFRDVADVIGILLGQPFRRKTLDSGGVYAEVDGVVTRAASAVIECAEISIPSQDRYLLYHFEFSDSYNDHDTHCGRGIILRSRAENIALGVALVKFFGGFVDFNDSDDQDCDFAWPEQMDIRANNGEAWSRYHERMLALKPITKKEIDQYRNQAAY